MIKNKTQTSHISYNAFPRKETLLLVFNFNVVLPAYGTQINAVQNNSINSIGEMNNFFGRRTILSVRRTIFSGDNRLFRGEGRFFRGDKRFFRGEERFLREKNNSYGETNDSFGKMNDFFGRRKILTRRWMIFSGEG